MTRLSRGRKPALLVKLCKAMLDNLYKWTKPSPRLEKHILKLSAPEKGNLWIWHTAEFLGSIALMNISIHGRRCLDRLIVEHLNEGRVQNGRLIVTQSQFQKCNIRRQNIAAAIDELTYFGLVKVKRGRSGTGTAHPNLYTLTFQADYDGYPPTNDWQKVTEEHVLEWPNIKQTRAMQRSKKHTRNSAGKSANLIPGGIQSEEKLQENKNSPVTITATKPVPETRTKLIRSKSTTLGNRDFKNKSSVPETGTAYKSLGGV